DRLLLHDVDWACYEEHQHICPLQPINLYSGWIKCGPMKVQYLPERVLRQFGYVQTIPRLPHKSAPINTSLRQIDNR
ncbi:putative IMP dehydrogenase/GMP reductase, partial [Trifolium medium]|nr:putative IMP dehydrogenase/GMP reductase [Trifolium medium]